MSQILNWSKDAFLNHYSFLELLVTYLKMHLKAASMLFIYPSMVTNMTIDSAKVNYLGQCCRKLGIRLTY